MEGGGGGGGGGERHGRERELEKGEIRAGGESCGGEKSEMGCGGKEIARKVEKEIGEV